MIEDQNFPKLPKRFIEHDVITNMKTGDIGYIHRGFAFKLDENRNLWVSKNQEFDTIPDSDSDNDDDSDKSMRLLRLDKNVKIEKTESGYKLYIYEYFEFLWEKRFNCSSLSDCNSSIKKNCSCKQEIRQNLFNKEEMDDEQKKKYVCITEFDKPGKKINDPIFLQNLNTETVAELKTEELEKILRNSLDDELYEVANIVRIELDKRKN